MVSLTDRIIGIESGGNANAKNPRSSATGLGQFIDSTWLDMIKRHRPDLAGLPRSEILAMRSDPQLSRQMTDAYAAENAERLSKAGFEASPGNTYLAHFAGPSGAVKVLGADPTAPVSSVLGLNVVRANPFLAKMTAGDLIAWAGQKMGGGAPSAPSAPTLGAPQMPAGGPSGGPLPISMLASLAQQGRQQATANPMQAAMAFMQSSPAAPAPDFQFAPPRPKRPIDIQQLQALLQAPAMSRGFSY